MNIKEYSIQETNEPRWYILKVSYGEYSNSRYAMLSSATLDIDSSGHVVSFNGCGRTNEGFRRANLKLFPMKCWNRGREGVVLADLEEVICDE